MLGPTAFKVAVGIVVRYEIAARQRYVKAGKKSGECRNHSAKILADHRKFMAINGGDSAKATASCAKKHERSPGHIRRIIAAARK